MLTHLDHERGIPEFLKGVSLIEVGRWNGRITILLGPCSYVGDMDLSVVVLVIALVASVVAVIKHWGMLNEVCRDRTGSYVLSQYYKTLILASVLQVSIYCEVLSWLHHEGLHSCCCH